MELETFEDIIKFAIKREEAAIVAYGNMMVMAKSPGLKELLGELRGEEENHKKLLEDIAKEKIEVLELKDVTDLKISDYLVEEAPNADMSFQDLLILAAKKEQDAVEIYSGLAEKCEDAELKKLFEFLVLQEKSHKLKLEREYDTHVLDED